MGNLVIALNQAESECPAFSHSLWAQLSQENMQIGTTGAIGAWIPVSSGNSSVDLICFSSTVVVSGLYWQSLLSTPRGTWLSRGPSDSLGGWTINLCPEPFVTISSMERVDIAGPWLTSMSGLFYNIMIPLLCFCGDLIDHLWNLIKISRLVFLCFFKPSPSASVTAVWRCGGCEGKLIWVRESVRRQISCQLSLLGLNESKPDRHSSCHLLALSLTSLTESVLTASPDPGR